MTIRSIQLAFSANNRLLMPSVKRIASQITIENLLSLEYMQELGQKINKIIKK